MIAIHKYINHAQLIQHLRKFIDSHGGTKEAAHQLQIQPGHLHCVVKGTRKISKYMIRKLGYKMTPFYERFQPK